jgi:hypothetical protein
VSLTPHLIADAIPLLDVSAYLAGERAAFDTLAAELAAAFGRAQDVPADAAL